MTLRITIQKCGTQHYDFSIVTLAAYAECHYAECHRAALPSKWYAETPSLGDLVVVARPDALLSY
jgi:hypothetical protein